MLNCDGAGLPKKDSPISEPAKLSLRTEVIERLDAISASAWNQLCDSDNPFIEHAFLTALEKSGCVGEGTGWIAQHLVVWEGDQLVAAMPVYLKDNSYGEYIFDWNWADASLSAGIPYYPKLVSSVPFTPVAGPRLLLARSNDSSLVDALLMGLAKLAQTHRVSSSHVLFLPQKHQHLLGETYEFIPRLSYQFHWTNLKYTSFDQYLSTFRSAARKNVKRERERVRDGALCIETLEGECLSDREWDALYVFYRSTASRKWGHAYLNRPFFEIIKHTFRHRIVASLASIENRYIAGTLCFTKGAHLYGRYWGCTDAYDSLHFELCYYQPITYAIEHRLRRFEAGAQGVHKLKRGLLPHPTYSAHLIEHPHLARAIAEAVAREDHAVRTEMQTLVHHGPFKRASLT